MANDPDAEPDPEMESESIEDSSGTGDESDSGTNSSDRWITDTHVLDAELPGDVQATMERLLDEDSVETLNDWIAEVRRRTGGESISVDDLCHADSETNHWGELSGERYHFLCFYDAVILAALADRPVDIRTESPNRAVIEAHAAGTSDLSVDPTDAVFSFGINEGVEPPEGSLSPADIYSAVCPYVRAFPDLESYERWAETVPAATVAMPLAGATDIAEALVE